MLDSLFPWFVGNRTQIIATIVAALKLAVMFGAPAAQIGGVVDVLTPIGAGMLAAKISRTF